MAVPAAGFLIPLFLLLLIQALSVSRAERSFESKVCGVERGHLDVRLWDQDLIFHCLWPLRVRPSGLIF